MNILCLAAGALGIGCLGAGYANRDRLYFYSDPNFVESYDFIQRNRVQETRIPVSYYHDILGEIRDSVLCWYLPNPRAARSSRTVFFFHGNAGNISHRQRGLEMILQNTDWNIVIPDYISCFSSPTIEDCQRAIRACVEYYIKDIPEDSIIFFGESIGCSFALSMAAEWSVGNVLCLGGFQSIASMIPVLLPWYLRWTKHIVGDLDNNRAIQSNIAAITLLHSREDEIVPYQQAEELLERNRERDIVLFNIQGTHMEPEIPHSVWCQIRERVEHSPVL